MFVEAVAAAKQTLPADLRDEARLVFTAHSIPLSARSRCGTDLYARQVAYASRLVADRAGYADYDQVWQSRSGPPQVPWLEPDVADHLSALAEARTKAVIVCPIGFVADHIEVVWDLDSELRQQADELGLAFARAATPNADRRFAQLALDLIDELRDGREPSRAEAPPGLDSPPTYGFSVDGALCTPECGKA
jgi:ferrochelatase